MYTRSSVKYVNSHGTKRLQALLHYKDDTGKWKTKTQLLPRGTGKREGKKLAEEWRVRMNAALSKAPLVLPVNYEETLDAVVRRYLKYQLTIHEITELTYETQIHNYDKWIKPYLGAIGFKSIDRVMVVEWLSQLNSAGLKQSSIYAFFKIPRKIYTYYQKIGEISLNPFDMVALPGKDTPNTTHLTQEQTQRFLECAEMEYEEFSPMRTALLLLFYTGMRRGEVCGLRWRNVEANSIIVDTAVATTYHSCYLKLPKEDRIRTIPMVPQIKDYLDRMRQSINPDKTWFVIGNETEYMKPQYLTKHFTTFRRKYDLKDYYGKSVIPHGLRHNFAATAISAKADVAALSSIMGHASMKITLDTYGDALEESKVVAISHIGERFNELTNNQSDV